MSNHSHNAFIHLDLVVNWTNHQELQFGKMQGS